MEIKGFHVIEEKDFSNLMNRVLINDAADLSPYGFDLKGTFESGQCFRWVTSDNIHYSGIVKGKSVVVSIQDGRHLLIENATAEDFSDVWHHYFDLSTDYAPIIKKIDKDDFMHESVLYSGGARMLCQDFEETVFSYILSSQNNIPRIKKLVESLCEQYGDKIHSDSHDKNFLGYAFPACEKLSRQFCTSEHADCRANNLCGNPFGGYRCTYIKKTAQMLASNAITLDFGKLAAGDAKSARAELCRFPGVGEKVADCILLYSGIRKDICPIDTWVEKTIKSEYLGDNASKKEIRAFTESYFAEYAGYAQLWFFNYIRNSRNA